MSDLIVKPPKTKKTTLPQSAYMKSGIINKFPSMLLVVGRSGSGKSSVISYMANNENFIKGFYNDVYLMSPTCEIDDLCKTLKIPKKNMIKNNFEESLTKILDSQEQHIKNKGIKKTGEKNKVLIILDDIISDPKFLKSDAMVKLATMGRHFLISSVINTQSYTKVPRVIRLQSNGIILFPSSNNEIKLVADDTCPPNCSKKDFMSLIAYATKGKHDFLYINNFEPAERRFRKGFTQYLVCKKK